MFIDILFIALLIIAIFKGMSKGLILSLFSIIAFIVGLAAAIKLSAIVANRFANNQYLNSKWVPFVSFILVFIAVAIVVKILASIIQRFAEMLMLGWLNKLAGVLLFMLLYGIIYSVFLFYGTQLHIIQQETIHSSIVYHYICPLAPKIMDIIGTVIPFFKDIFAQLGHFFESNSNKL